LVREVFEANCKRHLGVSMDDTLFLVLRRAASAFLSAASRVSHSSGVCREAYGGKAKLAELLQKSAGRKAFLPVSCQYRNMAKRRRGRGEED
jgi:hypothetical protein